MKITKEDLEKPRTITEAIDFIRKIKINANADEKKKGLPGIVWVT